MAETMEGIVPIVDPNRGYREWLISEVYTGQAGVGAYVPNPDDSVRDWKRGTFRVLSVDYSTGLSELIPFYNPSDNEYSKDDLLLGIGPGPDYESWRLLIDTSVIPHRMKVEDRNHTYGELTHYYRVFLGTLTEGANARVISANYDASGQYIGDTLPMEIAASTDVANRTIRYPVGGYTNDKLQNGTVVTLVVYAADGIVVSYNKMLVVNTSFIRRFELGQKYIESISLESPFLTDVEASTIEAPINLPISALTLSARIHYSDGSYSTKQVNNGKVRLYGLDNYIATIAGERAGLTLTYMLDDNETAINVENPGDKHIGKKYWIRTTDVVGSYSVKLFVVPKWADAISGWRLEYYLFTLDRGDMYYVTPFVEPAANAPAFKPLEYGVTQNLVVSVDMDKVDARLKPYRHVQAFSIALMANGVEDRTPYLISYTPGQTPEYGLDISARLTLHSIGDWTLKLDQGKTTLVEWLNVVYYPTHPLYNPQTESGPMMPTHFVVNINGIRYEYPIADWNRSLTSETGGVVGSPVIIEWVAKTTTSTLKLGCSGLKIVHETPAPR